MKKDYKKGLLKTNFSMQNPKSYWRPNTQKFLKIVENNQLKTVPSQQKDKVAAEAIHGPDIGALKEKTTRKNNSCINCPTYTHTKTIQRYHIND